MANILHYPRGDKVGRQMEMTRPLTPRSERWPDGRIPSVRATGNGCPSRKCIRHVGHPGECWPQD